MLGLLLRLAGVALATAVAVSVITVAVNGIITARTIREQAKIKCPQAFKALVTSKGTRKVGVGLFNRNNTKLSEMTLETNEDITENLSVGQVIYI